MAGSKATWEEAAEAAKRALRQCSDEGIIYLQNVCENGGLCGRDYGVCFYGNLARGEGYLKGTNIHAKEFEVVETFARSIGVELRQGQMDPIEEFCFPVLSGQTYRRSDALAHLLLWCDDVLRERARLDMGIELAEDDLVAEKQVMIH